VASCAKPLVISSVAPPRRTTTTSSAPERCRTARKPSLIDSTPTTTVTTPVTPNNATSVELARSRMLRKFMTVTAPICASQFPSIVEAPIPCAGRP
jgi:hypothetical protein